MALSWRKKTIVIIAVLAVGWSAVRGIYEIGRGTSFLRAPTDSRVLRLSADDWLVL